MLRLSQEEETKLRAAIVEEAKTWIDTPFHNRAAVKGVGVECGWLSYGVLRNLNLLPPGYEMPDYSPQFWMNRGDEVYIEGIIKAGFTEIGGPPQSTNIPLPGDLIVAKMGRVFAHGGIIVEWPMVIHSNPDTQKVRIDNVEINRIFNRDHPRKFFTMFEPRTEIV